jgi:ER-derived vesicles protein
MVLSDSLYRRKVSFAGLPDPSDPKPTNKTYFQLAGRVLLIFLFLGLIFRGGQWGTFRIVVSLLELVACIMVIVGFKAKSSAMFLVAFLSILNVFINDFWNYRHKATTQDFLKYCLFWQMPNNRYDFFQTLSIVGGLLLLVNMGPGELSYDEKKKNH